MVDETELRLKEGDEGDVDKFLANLRDALLRAKTARVGWRGTRGVDTNPLSMAEVRKDDEWHVLIFITTHPKDQ